MTPHLRPAEPRDHAVIIALNQANLPAVSEMDEDRLLYLLHRADRADVVELDERVAGFVLTFAPGVDYDSENYQWFTSCYDSEFYYLDRIVIADDVRRSGLGSFIYDEIERVAAPWSRLTLEVNTIPLNEASLAFHHRRGYAEVGTLGDATKAVALMAKELGSA